MSRSAWQLGTLLSATLATGLTAGVFGDWAHTIMRGLATTDDRTFLGAFQALDRAILNPLFLLPFVGALVTSGAAVLLHRRVGDRPVLRWAAMAFGLLVVAFVVTTAVHEPLNTVVRDAGDLARIGDPAALRDAVDEARWAAWHVVRTVATAVAFGCLLWALVVHGRVGAHATDHAASRPGSRATR